MRDVKIYAPPGQLGPLREFFAVAGSETAAKTAAADCQAFPAPSVRIEGTSL